MLYTHDLHTVMETERMVRPINTVAPQQYTSNVARRYAAVKTLKYPMGNDTGLGARTRDALIEAMRLDAEEAVVVDRRLDRYVEIVKSDRAKSYAWWYALIIDPVAASPFSDDCSGVYKTHLGRADRSSLEEYLEISSRYFTHAEVDRCLTEVRVAYRYLNAM